ncbi:MAG: hypothetical protein HWN65_06580 [Candidatus Helarchaeota archaeon]|nr:hypothetical protein [Candidatus Helarchaeota archaeon]
MGKELELDLENEPYSKLSKMADDLGLSLKRMCKHILEEFTFQGKVYGGVWPEGPGKRIIIDFPKYSSRVLKLKEKELK